MSDVKLAFGLRDDVLVHISGVERGLACGCVCPGCKSMLVAKKGSNAHHFAHFTKSTCSYQPETALHNHAKNLIAKETIFQLPRLHVFVSGDDVFSVGYSFDEVIAASSVFVRRSFVEKEYQDVVPDVQLETDSGMVFVEIAVTHFVDREKQHKLKRIGIPTIEIDLSTLPMSASLDEINKTILSDLSFRSWIFHPTAEEIRGRLRAKLQNKLNEAESHRYGNVYERDDSLSWGLLYQTSEYFGEGAIINRQLLELSSEKRIEKYRSLDDLEKILLNCHVMNIAPLKLPSIFTRNEYGESALGCPVVVWRTGVFVRWVEKNNKEFSLLDVVDWTIDRYPVSRSINSQVSKYELTTLEQEIYDFLEDLELEKYLESDGWAAKYRRYQPARKISSLVQMRGKSVV